MTYVVSWGRPGSNHIRFGGADELDEVLEKVCASAELYATLLRFADEATADDPDTSQAGRVALLVGHPYRAALIYTSGGGSPACAVQTAVPALGFGIVADVDGEFRHVGPDATRLTRGMARTAARQWLETRRRPTCVSQWSRITL